MGDFLDPVEGADIVKGVDAGGEAAVEAEDLVVNECSEGEEVKEVCEESILSSQQTDDRKGKRKERAP